MSAADGVYGGDDAVTLAGLVDEMAAQALRITRLEGRLDALILIMEDAKPKKAASARDQVEALQIDEDIRKYAQHFGMRGESLEQIVEDWRLFMQSNGYKVGRNPVANAKASLLRWIRVEAEKRQARLDRQNPPPPKRPEPEMSPQVAELIRRSRGK